LVLKKEPRLENKEGARGGDEARSRTRKKGGWAIKTHCGVLTSVRGISIKKKKRGEKRRNAIGFTIRNVVTPP